MSSGTLVEEKARLPRCSSRRRDVASRTSSGRTTTGPAIRALSAIRVCCARAPYTSAPVCADSADSCAATAAPTVTDAGTFTNAITARTLRGAKTIRRGWLTRLMEKSTEGLDRGSASAVMSSKGRDAAGAAAADDVGDSAVDDEGGCLGSSSIGVESASAIPGGDNAAEREGRAVLLDGGAGDPPPAFPSPLCGAGNNDPAACSSETDPRLPLPRRVITMAGYALSGVTLSTIRASVISTRAFHARPLNCVNVALPAKESVSTGCACVASSANDADLNSAKSSTLAFAALPRFASSKRCRRASARSPEPAFLEETADAEAEEGAGLLLLLLLLLLSRSELPTSGAAVGDDSAEAADALPLAPPLNQPHQPPPDAAAVEAATPPELAFLAMDPLPLPPLPPEDEAPSS